MYDEINPDILEILLSHRFGLACVLQGELAYDTLFLHIVHQENSFFKMSRILFHSSFRALDPELLQEIFSEIYPNTPPYKTAEIVANTPNKVKIPGVNMDKVKFSLWDHQAMEHHIRLYETLVAQTNDLEPLKLGKRVVFVPNNIPRDFNGIERMWCQLLKEDPDPELLAENLVHPLTDDDLTHKKLQRHRKNYDACINVTPENRRLYTRSRFLINMFIDMQPYLKSEIAYNYNTSRDALDDFIGAKVKTVLTDNFKYSLDKDNYPVFSQLHTHGALANKVFPTSQALPYSPKGNSVKASTEACFCGNCADIPYSLYLYESKSGKVYVIVVLNATDHAHFIKYLNSQSCYYELYKCLKNHPEWSYRDPYIGVLRPPLPPYENRYLMPENQTSKAGTFFVHGQKFVPVSWKNPNLFHLRPEFSRTIPNIHILYGYKPDLAPKLEIGKLIDEFLPKKEVIPLEKIFIHENVFVSRNIYDLFLKKPTI